MLAWVGRCNSHCVQIHPAASLETSDARPARPPAPPSLQFKDFQVGLQLSAACGVLLTSCCPLLLDEQFGAARAAVSHGACCRALGCACLRCNTLPLTASHPSVLRSQVCLQKNPEHLQTIMEGDEERERAEAAAEAEAQQQQQPTAAAAQQQ